ncbi:MAG: family 78 glycoside hydrolase catalytic domain [Mogibacterium sp.]|nr:family 78 glycoside hydrolase catalytic domain [Mogibacterium sp.]
MKLNWITSGSDKPFYIRKKFDLNGRPAEALLYASGLGQFNAYINGKRVGDHYLDPAWTDYRRQVLYLSFDVSELLADGSNAIVLEIGNGWYNWDTEYGYSFHFPPFMPPNPNPYKPYGSSLVGAFELRIRYADRTEEIISSADGCRTASHGVLHSNVYGSELISGRELKKGCSMPGYDDSDWQDARAAAEDEAPLGAASESLMPPVRAVGEYEAEYLHTVNGRRIYDLGQNISGILSAEARGKAGTQLDFYPAEKLDDAGDADQMAKNWMMIDNVVSYILSQDDAWESFSQTFTYFSGRYIAVSGDAEIRGLKGTAISSAWKRAGSFICDDERYNRIYDMIEKTVEANMVGVHTDCPQIERFAWQEPNHLMAPSIFFMKDGKALWEKFLTDLRLAQHGPDDIFYDLDGKAFTAGDGLVPSQAPCYIPNVLPVPGMGSFYDIIPWGSTCILGTWWHYQFYGDVSIIKDNYETGMRYLEYLKTKVNDEGFLNHGLGDWGNPENELARENTETAFLYADALTLSRFAVILGRDEDAAALNDYAQEIRRNYNARLLGYNEELGCMCYRAYDHGDEFFVTQSVEALPLFWGMVPEEYENDVVKALRYALESKDALIAGEVGLPYVIMSARRYGMNDLIAEYIMREEHPSYYAFVLDGETTLGEYWETNPRSHCHDMMGHIIEWFYSGIAGIHNLEPGFACVAIEPYMPEGMNSFKCSYETPLGMISVEGERKESGPAYTAHIPQRICANVADNVSIVREHQ